MFLIIREQLGLQSFSVAHLCECQNLGSHGLLCEPEVLIHRIFQQLAEEEDLRIIVSVEFDCLHDGGSPFDYKLLESIPLIQKGEHELLHGLPRLLIREALVIILMFGIHNFNDQVFGLFQRVQLHLRKRVGVVSCIR